MQFTSLRVKWVEAEVHGTVQLGLDAEMMSEEASGSLSYQRCVHDAVEHRAVPPHAGVLGPGRGHHHLRPPLVPDEGVRGPDRAGGQRHVALAPALQLPR